MDARLSRTSSLERGKEREEAWGFDGATESRRAAVQESEENKENLLMASELKDDLLLYQDEEALNDSVISGEDGLVLRGGLLPEGASWAGTEPVSEFVFLPGHEEGTRPRAWCRAHSERCLPQNDRGVHGHRLRGGLGDTHVDLF